MLVQELQIEGFRSLKSVIWKPGRLNVLIGPNGGGKSNLLRALDVIRIAATGGLREAILRMGGMVPLVWDGAVSEIKFRLKASGDQGDPTQATYRLRLVQVGKTGEYQIAQEEIPPGGGFQHVTSGTEAQLSRIEYDDNPWAHALRQNARAWSIHSDMRVDQDAELRRAAVTRSEGRIEPDGQNLIAVLHTLYVNDDAFHELIDNAMWAAFPDDYAELIFPPAERGRIEMLLRRKHRKRPDSAADLSDGTLRFLLLMTILGSSDPAPLIAIDEPEAGLHPRMLPIIASVAANASLKSQIIFTTHAPQFLDAFHEELPATTIVTSNGSGTELKTIEGRDLKRWVENYSLGKFAFSGEAEAVL